MSSPKRFSQKVPSIQVPFCHINLKKYTNCLAIGVKGEFFSILFSACCVRIWILS